MDEINNLEVGNRIKNIRLSKGHTMESFGKLLNTSKGTVNNWEKGRNLPNKENLKSIADLAGLSVDQLLYGNVNQTIKDILVEDINNHGKLYDEIMDILNSTMTLIILDYEEYTDENGKTKYREKNFPEKFKARREKALEILDNNFDLIVARFKNENINPLDKDKLISEVASLLFSKNIPRSLSFMGKSNKFINLYYDSIPSFYLKDESLEVMKDFFLKEDHTVKNEKQAYKKAVDMKYQYKLYDASEEFYEKISALLIDYKNELAKYE